MENTATASNNLVRWPRVVNAFILLLTLGLIYAWSIFVKPLEAEFGWTRAQTSLTFTFSMVFFTIGGFVSGYITSKLKPRITVALSAVLLFAGFFFVSRTNALSTLYISYGVVCGLSVGMAYNAILSAVVPWFPDKGGTVTGIMLMGFGFGSMVLGPVVGWLVTSMGWRTAFLIIGIFSFAVMLLALFLLVPPAPDTVLPEPKRKPDTTEGLTVEMPPGQMLKRPAFWLFLTWGLFIAGGGLSIIGHAAPIMIELGGGAVLATLTVSCVAFANGIARFCSGMIWDRFGRKKAMLAINCIDLTGLALVLIAGLTAQPYVFLIGAMCVGAAFGGASPLNSAFVFQFYGRKHYPMNFSLINSALIVGSFMGPTAVGSLRTLTGTYVVAFILVLVYGCISFLERPLIKRP